MTVALFAGMITVMKQAVLETECREIIEDKCPYCGRIYFYVRDSLYRPRTCNDWKCLRKDLHPNIVIR